MKAVRLVNTATAEMLAKKTTKTIPGFAVSLSESFSEIEADFSKSADEAFCSSIQQPKSVFISSAVSISGCPCSGVQAL
jgi:hypothetical protein